MKPIHLLLILSIQTLVLSSCDSQTPKEPEAEDKTTLNPTTFDSVKARNTKHPKWEYCTITLDDTINFSNAALFDGSMTSRTTTKVQLVTPTEVHDFGSLEAAASTLREGESQPATGRIAEILNSLGREGWEVVGVTRDSHVVTRQDQMATGPLTVYIRIAYTLKRQT